MDNDQVPHIIHITRAAVRENTQVFRASGQHDVAIGTVICR